MLIQPFVNYNLPHGWYLTSCTHYYSKLGNKLPQKMDSARWRRSRQDSPRWEVAREYEFAIF